MRAALIAGAIVVAGLAAYLLFFQNPSYNNYPPHPGPIIAFGDSLVFGTGASEGRDFVSQLAQLLREPVENFGVPGDTTAEALERISEATDRHPSIVLVLLGGNDYLQRVPQEQTFQNLAAIVDAFQKDGAVVVLLGVRGGILVDNFRAKFKALAQEKRAVYVSDVLRDLLGNRQYMSDQIHPNDAGYAIIAERVFNALRPILK